jgi:hypothetical protein
LKKQCIFTKKSKNDQGIKSKTRQYWICN